MASHNEIPSDKSVPIPEKAEGEIMELDGTDGDQAAKEFTQFWRSSSAVAAEKGMILTDNDKKDKLRGIPRPLANTKFLHSNATSHKWAFGAIAELIDNAVDEIPNGATHVIVDRIMNPRDKNPALLIQDNGGGMDPDSFRLCFGFGFSSKNPATSVGRYGNGFKTSTMRLATDVIVFTRTLPPYGSLPKVSIALLSQTFLIQTERSGIVAPVLDFEISSAGHPMPFIHNNSSTTIDAWNRRLDIILKWSPFSTLELLLEQFDGIGAHGTKIVLYNLYNDDNIPELDFDTDEHDIQLKRPTSPVAKDRNLAESHISYRLQFSLRVYASILYLNSLPNNFRIILRGVPVQPYRIADALQNQKVVLYKPAKVAQRGVCVSTNIGFIENARQLNVHGFNIYHKNRLILPFWRVFQENSSRGKGVVGVLEVNYIQPTHNKQDFERTDVFARLENKLKEMQIDFWKQNCHLIGYQFRPSKSASSTVVTDIDQNDQQATKPTVSRKRRRSFEGDEKIAEEEEGIPMKVQSDFAAESSELHKLRKENAELLIQLEDQKQVEKKLNETLSQLTLTAAEWRKYVENIEQLVKVQIKADVKKEKENE